jgi:serine/threonine-protein kinase
MQLTPDQWQRVKALFHQAEDRPPAEREAWLSSVCSDDEVVLQEVISMMALRDATSDVLKTPVKVSSFDNVPSPSLEGARLGPWKVEEAIGRGGMGEVWRAERADGLYELKVAIKLLKRGMDTDAIVERFMRERRILAQLDHPNIARLIDAGATDDGRPYLVMELIRGQTLTDWCASKNLDVRARIRLFEQVCEAVHAAHRQNVVHRDLKPSNVLVNDEGEIKLLDFGIAKLLDSTDEETLTAFGSAPVTPNYASPEQLLCRAVTPATDVYALGVLLYHLLTGKPPQRHDSLALAVFAAAREDTQIERPSAAVQAVESGSRGKELAETLQFELDWIVLKALAREPSRRYANGGELADDLRRYLDHRPVLARPESKLYLLGRFARRHRVAVSAATIAVPALVMGLAGTLWQAHRAREQAALAQQEALHAQSETNRAERVKNFLVSIFNAADPEQAQQKDVPTQELINRGAEQIKIELAGEPLVQADLYEAFSKIEVSLGDPKKAVEYAESSLALRRAHLDPVDVKIGDSLVALGDAQVKGDAYDQAVANLQAADALFSKAKGDHREQRAEALAGLGDAKMKMASHDEPIALHQQALSLLREALGPRARKTLDEQARYALVLEDCDKYEEAEKEFRDVIRLMSEVYSPNHSQVAIARLSLADVLIKRDHPDQAVEESSGAIQILRQVYGERHPSVGEALFVRGEALSNAGHEDQALPDFQLALTMAVPNSFMAAQLERALGTLLFNMERYPEAEQHARAAIEAFRIVAPMNAQVYESIADLGDIEVTEGKAREAEGLLRDAVDNIAKRTAAGSYASIKPRLRLGQALFISGQNDKAIAYLRENIALNTRLMNGTDNLPVYMNEMWLGEALLVKQDPKDLPELRRIADHAVQPTLKRDVFVSSKASLLDVASAADRQSGNPAQAKAESTQAMTLLRDELGKVDGKGGPPPLTRAHLTFQLAEFSAAQKIPDTGALYDQAIAGLKQASPHDCRLGNMLLGRARWRFEHGNRVGAAADLREATVAMHHDQAPDSAYLAQAEALLRQVQ